MQSSSFIETGHWRIRSEFTLRPQCRRSSSVLTLISFASAAKVGSEPILLKKSLLL
jgi:hypothetical protein